MFFDWIQRKRHAKGYGIHSPFAFNFITKVVYNPCAYNAFFDIEKILAKNKLSPDEITEFNRLSFRLVNYFRPKTILEVNSRTGINTMFITAPYKNIRCFCYEKNASSEETAKKLQQNWGRTIFFVEYIDLQEKFDAIFVDPVHKTISSDNLFTISHDDTFWLIKGIDSKYGRTLWQEILNDERARITFDMRKHGIVILKKSYHKLNYLI